MDANETTGIEGNQPARIGERATSGGMSVHQAWSKVLRCSRLHWFCNKEA
jgi:hypothetical protein